MSARDRQLLTAHAAQDLDALVEGYTRAGAEAASPEARGFFLTQAYVFALEAGHADAATLHAALSAMGREA
jgi:hypothetical protein